MDKQTIIEQYKKNFIIRYDKDGIIPYLSFKDFPGLVQETGSFTDSKGINICYFIYYYPKTQNGKKLLFLPGVGPGHTAYMTEIEYFCKAGFCVYTLDYAGTGESGGDNLISFTQPAIDTDELLDVLKLGQIEIASHSLGSYTTLNLLMKHYEIKRAVFMAGFISVRAFAKQLICTIPGVSALASGTLAEREIFENALSEIIQNEADEAFPFKPLVIPEFLSKTDDTILFIQSEDDPVVNFKESVGHIKDFIPNPNFSFIIEKNKKHNPNYTREALCYMYETFGQFNAMTDILEKKKFMQDKSARMMTVQDEKVMSEVIRFLK